MLFLGLLASALTAALPACTVHSNDKTDLVQLVPLDPAGLDLEEHARASLIAAYEFTSTDRMFGGISGLRFVGDDLLLVSDRGSLWRARASFGSSGALNGLEGWQAHALQPGRTFDIEALERSGERGLILATERRHGLHVIDDHEEPASIRALGTLPPPMDDLPFNRGIEALAMIGQGLLLLSEGEAAGGERGRMPGLVLDEEAKVRARFVYEPADGFAPTDAVALADDLLIIERSASILGGFQIRLVIVPQEAIRDGAVLSGEPLWRLRHSPLADNFEALDARTDNGSTHLYLVSDDNFSGYQRSLLLELRLEE